MRLAAYVLAADPTWIEKSVAAYYDLVDTIVVTSDESGRGWTGSAVDSESALARLRVIDPERKMRFLTGNYHGQPTAAQDELVQRQAALDLIGTDADWVLQIDTDEVLPDVEVFLAALRYAEDRGLRLVEWPMRVLFRRLTDHRFLAVAGENGRSHFEYPGAIAVRPGVTLIDARRGDEPFLRPVARGDESSLQVTRPAAAGEDRSFVVEPEEAILHNSWGRPPAVVLRKVRSWGHYAGLRSWWYYVGTWLPSKYLWRWQRDLHPFAHGLWPRLVELDVD